MFFNRLKFKDGVEGEDYVTCKICGIRSNCLFNDIKRHHKMSLDEYCEKFGLSRSDLFSKKYSQEKRDTTTKAIREGKISGWKRGDQNPARRPEVRLGRMSPFSMNYHKYDELTDDEKRARIKEYLAFAQRQRDANHNNTTTLDYYTSRGYSNQEAKEMLRKRQQTFSLKKCIEKYGVEQGTARWEARQKKWLDTLNRKSAKEKNRINRLKLKGMRIANSKTYSDMSQKLFDRVFDLVKDNFKTIQYATRAKGICQINELGNLERTIRTDDHSHCYLVDFFVEDNGKIIEFDGDFWHQKRLKRDKVRDEYMKNMGYKVLRVSDTEYEKDPNSVVKRCVKFLLEE